MWLSSTSGYSAPTRVTTSRQSCDTSSTFALSTEVSRRERVRAALKATWAMRSTFGEEGVSEGVGSGPGGMLTVGECRLFVNSRGCVARPRQETQQHAVQGAARHPHSHLRLGVDVSAEPNLLAVALAETLGGVARLFGE